MKLRAALSLIPVLLATPYGSAATAPLELVPTHPAPDSLTAAGDSSAPTLSPDGTRVLFLSTSDSLVTNDFNGLTDVFLRDRVLGHTELVSVGLHGFSGNGKAVFATLSANGRFAVFVSDAGDLVDNDTNGVADVFVRDLEQATTRLVSVATNGLSGNHSSGAPSVSADGRWIAFESLANDLAPGPTNDFADVFVFDQENGTVTRLSPPSEDPLLADRPSGHSTRPLISADGSTAVFRSLAWNLAPGLGVTATRFAHTNQLYVRRPLTSETRMVPVYPDGERSPTLLRPLAYSLSDDGRRLAVEVLSTPANLTVPRAMYLVDLDLNTFIRVAPDLVTASPSTSVGLAGPFLTGDGEAITFESRVPIGNGATGAVVLTWNVASGELTQVSSGGLTNVPGSDPPAFEESPFGDLLALNANGDFIAFIGGHPDDPPGNRPARHLMVRHLPTGELRRISPLESPDNDYPVVHFSADGRRMAFQSRIPNLVEADMNRDFDVFLYDWDTDALELASIRHPSRVSTTGFGPIMPRSFKLSANGRYLVYESANSPPLEPEFHGIPNVFVLDLSNGSNVLASVNSSGTGPGNRASFDPAISANGNLVAFTSLASDLVANDTNRVEDVFVRDLATGTTIRAGRSEQEGEDTSASSFTPAISRDGNWLAFARVGGPLGAYRQITLQELGSGTIRAVASSPWYESPSAVNSTRPRFSNGGGYLLFAGGVAGARLTHAYALTTDEMQVLSPESPVSSSFLWLEQQRPISTDAHDRYVAFPRQNDLAVHDLTTGELTVIATNAANPHLSADGRWIVYEAGSGPAGTRQILVTERESGDTSVVSVARDGMEPGDRNSSSPWISPDGRFVVFLSRADNLVDGDADQGPDIFLRDRVDNVTLRLSVPMDGTAPNGKSFAPTFDDDGRTLVFASLADNLVADDLNRRADLFLVLLPGAESNFRILAITRLSSGATTLLWAADPGRDYQVEYTESLTDPIWTALDVPIVLQDKLATAEDPANGHGSRRFYRLAASESFPAN